jgi:hypothetical protein
MGVHTGDSITVAPAQTLTDKEYQRLRDASLAIIREMGVECGGSNVQMAVNPVDGEGRGARGSGGGGAMAGLGGPAASALRPNGRLAGGPGGSPTRPMPTPPHPTPPHPHPHPTPTPTPTPPHPTPPQVRS